MSKRLQDAQNKELTKEEFEELTKIQGEYNRIINDPVIREYSEASELYERNIEKAKELIKQDDYKFVEKMFDHFDNMKEREENAARDMFVGNWEMIKGNIVKEGLKLVSKSVAKVASSAGATMDFKETLFLGDEEYTGFDEFTDMLLDLPKELERTIPTPDKWSRPVFTETVKKGEFEYDIKDGKIQAVRSKDGRIVEPFMSEQQEQEILAMDSKTQFNSSSFIYKGAQTGMDLAAMLLMTRGVGTTLGGSKLAYQTGVTTSTMAQMTGDLYRQGLEDFDGDKKKAGVYALGTSALIGMFSNMSGVEARLAGGKVPLLGESFASTIKSPWKRAIAMGVSSGMGEMVEETLVEQLLDASVRVALGELPQDIDVYEQAETALISFAMGALSGSASSSKPMLNDLDNASLTILTENVDKIPEVVSQEIKRRKGTTGSEEVDDDAERITNRIKKTAGKVNAVDIPNGKSKENVVGAMYEHTVAEEELERAKASKIEPLIQAKQADLEKADQKVAEVLELTVENPLLKEGEKVEVKPMAKPQIKKGEFIPQTKTDVIAQWFASGGRIKRSEYATHGDANFLKNKKNAPSVNLIKSYFETKNNPATENIDTLAESLSEEFQTEITIKDIVDFVKNEIKPVGHINETQAMRDKAESYNMSPDEYQEYDSQRSQVVDKYLGDVEATPQAIEAAGDVLMKYNDDGKVDMGKVEPELESVEPEVRKILTDGINKAKDEALSYEQQKLQEAEKAKLQPKEVVNPEVVKKKVKTEPKKENINPEVATEEVKTETQEPLGDNIQLAGVNIGKVPRKKLNIFLKKVFDNTFKTAGQLPKKIFKFNVNRKAKINAAMKRVGFDTVDLQRAIGSYNKAKKQKKLPEQDMKMLGDLLKDKPRLLKVDEAKFSNGDQIPLEILETLTKMRANIDKLSKEIKDSGISTEDLDIKIDENLGTYVHRSYRVHTDKDWVHKVEHLEQFNDAVKWVSEQAESALEELQEELLEKQASGLDTDHIENRIDRLESIINDPAAHVMAMVKEQADKSLNDVAHGAKIGSKNLGILKKRKTEEQLPEVIRNLYGEYVDPITTYAHSVYKMAHLIENHKFLEKIKEWGMGKVFFKDPTGDFNKKIVSRNDWLLSPLAESDTPIYTTDEIALAMETFDKPTPAPMWFRAILAGSVATKYSKTILSLSTQMRNFLQNTAFHWNNGHFLKMWDRKGWGDSMSAAWASMDEWAKGSEWARAEHEKMVGMGIFDESSTYGEMRALLKDFWNESGVYNPDDPVVKRGLRKIGKKAEGLYAWGDDAHKYFAYLLERARYSKALKGKKYDDLNDAEKTEIDEHVADIIRDTYQTYSMISPYVKELRKAPFTGSFISFTYEVYRNTKNNIKLGVKEIQEGRKTDNAALRNIGLSRLVGTSSMYLALAGIAKMATKFFDLGDDDDIRWFLPPWDEQALVIPISRDGNNVYVISTASTLPQGKIFSVIETALDERKGGAARMEKMMAESLEDFITWDIFTQHLIEAGSGVKLTGQEITNKDDPKNIEKRLKHMWKAVEPGTIRTAVRIGKSFINPERDYDKLNPAVELLSAFGGVRITSINLDRTISFPARDLGERRNSALRIYRKKARVDKYKNMSVRKRQEELSEFLKDSRSAYAKVYDETYKFVESSRRIGVSDKIIKEALIDGGWSKKEARKLMAGLEHIPLRND
jgi:hypothetical protein